MSLTSNQFKASADFQNETDAEILARIDRLDIPCRMIIDGELVQSDGGKTYTNSSGVNGATLGEIPEASQSDVDRAVEAAQRVCTEKTWSGKTIGERTALLNRFADLIEENIDELALLDSLDTGKPVNVAKNVDLGSALRTIRWYSELPDKIYGQVAPTQNFDLVIREPIGVVAAITPWNYPLMIAAWKFAPILAAGNPVILKPAEQSPLSAMRVGELAIEAGLPAGVFNVVTGHGEQAGRFLGSHDKVSAIGFTGSTETSKKFFEYASQSTLKSIFLECGGKSPGIVFEDADVKFAASAISGGLFYNSGQNCNAPTRILVHENVFDEFVAAAKDAAKGYIPDNPLSADTSVGAIVDEVQFNKIKSFINNSINDGAKCLLGGDQLHLESGGFYIEPTIIANVDSSMEIFKEEIFGPVMPITVFSDDDEALALSQDNKYGLWANIFTNDIDRMQRFSRNINAGTIAFNTTFGGDITTPFGGMKESGISRDRGVDGLQKYTVIKHISITNKG